MASDHAFGPLGIVWLGSSRNHVSVGTPLQATDSFQQRHGVPLDDWLIVLPSKLRAFFNSSRSSVNGWQLPLTRAQLGKRFATLFKHNHSSLSLYLES